MSPRTGRKRQPGLAAQKEADAGKEPCERYALSPKSLKDSEQACLVI